VGEDIDIAIVSVEEDFKTPIVPKVAIKVATSVI
jgi:hypothetical protein